MRITIPGTGSYELEIQGTVNQALAEVTSVSIFAYGQWRDITSWLRPEDKLRFEEKLSHFWREHQEVENRHSTSGFLRATRSPMP